MSEITNILEECAWDAAYLENAIGDWLAVGADIEGFPVVELQRLDLLQQVQHDLVSLLSSPHLIDRVDNSDVEIDIDAVVDVAKLDQIKIRLRQTPPSQDQEPFVGGRDKLECNGTVDLF